MNKKQIVIGITGPMGAGKTTICATMERRGCIIIDADDISHYIIEHNKECKDKLIKEFSEEILRENKSIDRKILARKAFKSKKMLNKLNEITHPFILIRIAELIFECKKEGHNVIVLDAPLLFESGADKFCDVTMAVLVPKNIRLKRIMKRDKLDKQSVLDRMSFQKPDEFYKSRAQYVLDGIKNYN